MALSDRLMGAASQLSAAICAGDICLLRDLPWLSLKLAEWADEARGLEEALRPPSRRERQMTPIAALMGRIVARVRP